MRTKFLASFLLMVASVSGQSTVELAGGVKAEVTSFGRARDTLNVAVKISNESKEKNTASLFTAIKEQLGLHLTAARGPVEYVIIDHVERPSPN